MTSRRLPPGSHGIPADVVARNQRERMVAAIAEACAERGYAETSVADVAKRAGVSSATFYKQFADKRDCALAAHRELSGRLLEAVDRAREEEGGDKARAALHATLTLLAADPPSARLLAVEILAVGPEGSQRHEALVEELRPAPRRQLGMGCRRPRRGRQAGARRRSGSPARARGQAGGDSFAAKLIQKIFVACTCATCCLLESGIMYNVRESWTDERMDDFAKHVDQRFEAVDKRFDKVDHELHRINDRLDGLHRVMIQAFVAMFGSTLAGFLVLAGLIVTQH